MLKGSGGLQAAIVNGIQTGADKELKFCRRILNRSQTEREHQPLSLTSSSGDLGPASLQSASLLRMARINGLRAAELHFAAAQYIDKFPHKTKVFRSAVRQAGLLRTRSGSLENWYRFHAPCGGYAGNCSANIPAQAIAATWSRYGKGAGQRGGHVRSVAEMNVGSFLVQLLHDISGSALRWNLNFAFGANVVELLCRYA